MLTVAKPTLYTFGLSVWAAVPELAMYVDQRRFSSSEPDHCCSAELYPEGIIEKKTLNLAEGENFAPWFLEIVCAGLPHQIRNADKWDVERQGDTSDPGHRQGDFHDH